MKTKPDPSGAGRDRAPLSAARRRPELGDALALADTRLRAASVRITAARV